MSKLKFGGGDMNRLLFSQCASVRLVLIGTTSSSLQFGAGCCGAASVRHVWNPLT